MIDKFVSLLGKLVWPSVMWFFHGLCRYRWWVIGCLLLFVIAPPSFDYYRAHYLEQEIVILVGAPGSSSERLGERLKNSLTEVTNQFGWTYRVRTEPTNGFEEIRRRLQTDVKGKLVGFQIDSRANTHDLRILYPMDFDYLHVLCNKRFLERHPGDAPTKVQNMDRVLLEMRSLFRSDQRQAAGRVFLGSPDGATRGLATRLFQLYGLDADLFSHPAIDDWNAARVGLLTDELDLVFFLGPKDGTTVTSIARDGSAVLLDLGALRGSLIDKSEYSLWDGHFPANSYSAVGINWQPKDEAARNALAIGFQPTDRPDRGLADLQFCPGEMKTIVARRLICSSNTLSDYDAWTVMRVADRTFRDSGSGGVGNWSSSPPPAVSGPMDGNFGIKLHQATRIFRENLQPKLWWNPINWSATVFSIVAAILLFVFTQWLGPNESSLSTAPMPGAKPARSEFQRLMAEIDLLRSQMNKTGPPPTEEDWLHLHTPLEHARAEVADLLSDKKISKGEATRLRRKLDELEQNWPRPVVKQPVTPDGQPPA